MKLVDLIYDPIGMFSILYEVSGINSYLQGHPKKSITLWFMKKTLNYKSLTVNSSFAGESKQIPLHYGLCVKIVFRVFQ